MPPRAAPGRCSSRSRASCRSLATPWRTVIANAGAEEEADLAELDLLVLVVVAGGAQHDEVDAVGVLLDLRAQVEVWASSTASSCSPKRAGRRRAPRAPGSNMPEPDEPWPPAQQMAAALGEGHRLRLLAPPVTVMGAVDDHATHWTPGLSPGRGGRGAEAAEGAPPRRGAGRARCAACGADARARCAPTGPRTAARPGAPHRARARDPPPTTGAAWPQPTRFDTMANTESASFALRKVAPGAPFDSFAQHDGPDTAQLASGAPRSAEQHLWLHFTRMSAARGDGLPIIVARRRLLPRGRERQALPRRRSPGLFAVQIGYSHGEEIGEAAARADARAALTTRTGATRTRAAIELAARGRRRWRPATSTASSSSPAARRPSSRPGSSRASTTRRAASAAGRPIARRHRLPRHDDGGAVDRRHLRVARAVRTAGAGRGARAQHEPLPPPGGARPRPSSPPAGVPGRRSRGGDHPGRAGDGCDGDHGARPERRRRHSHHQGLLEGHGGCLRPLRDPAVRRRGHHAASAASARGSAPSATTSSPT